jgi:hypothetical protein
LIVEREMAEAIQLIGSLKDGDLVRVTRDGHEHVMIVSGSPRRADGAFGSLGSIRVTVTYGPGKYATEVGADHLVRTRRGHGWIGGGTKLERVPDDACVSGPALQEYPEHDYDEDGMCRRCNAECEKDEEPENECTCGPWGHTVKSPWLHADSCPRYSPRPEVGE